MVILILNHTSINNLPQSGFENLEVLDLIGNKIVPASLIQMVGKCHSLKSLSVSDESYAEDVYFKIIAACPSIKLYNGQSISALEKFDAISKYGQHSTNIDFQYWDAVFCGLSSVQNQIDFKWMPELITELELKDCNLKEFHVGQLINLSVFLIYVDQY